VLWVVVLNEELFLFSEITGNLLINAIKLSSLGFGLLGNKNCVFFFYFYGSCCSLFDEQITIISNGFRYIWIRLINKGLFIPWLNKLMGFGEITVSVFVIHKTGLVVEGPTNWNFTVLDLAKLKTMH
jgi:hypothetical protein